MALAADVRVDERWLMDGMPPSRRHRGRFAAAALVVVTALGGAFAWRWHERGPGPASIPSAVDHFRASSSTATPAPVNLRPPAGVYVYRGRGHEHLSFMSTTQSQGPRLPGTVTVAPDGCWTFELAFNSFHRQMWHWCPSGPRLLEDSGTSFERFDFAAFTMGETSRFRCAPSFATLDVSATPGRSWPTHCTGHSETTNADVTTTGTVRFVGSETLSVGTIAVPTMHVHIDRLLTGGQAGEEHDDIWFATKNALPIRGARTIRAVSPAPAPLGQVTYTEDGKWQLTSLTPQR